MLQSVGSRTPLHVALVTGTAAAVAVTVFVVVVKVAEVVVVVVMVVAVVELIVVEQALHIAGHSEWSRSRITLIELSQYSTRFGVHTCFGSRFPSQSAMVGHSLHNAGHSWRASSRITSTSLVHTLPSENKSSEHTALSGTPSHSPRGVLVVVVEIVVVVEVSVTVFVVVVVTDVAVCVLVVTQELQRTGHVAIRNAAISGVLCRGSQNLADTKQCSTGSSSPRQLFVVVSVIVDVEVELVVVVLVVVEVLVLVVEDVTQVLQRDGQCFWAISAAKKLIDASQSAATNSWHSVAESGTPLQRRVHICQSDCSLNMGTMQFRWQEDCAVPPVATPSLTLHILVESSPAAQSARHSSYLDDTVAVVGICAGVKTLGVSESVITPVARSATAVASAMLNAVGLAKKMSHPVVDVAFHQWMYPFDETHR